MSHVDGCRKARDRTETRVGDRGRKREEENLVFRAQQGDPGWHGSGYSTCKVRTMGRSVQSRGPAGSGR